MRHKLLSILLLLVMLIPMTARAADYTGDGTAEIPISAHVASQATPEYFLSVPAVLTLEWIESNEDYEGTYNLGFKGTFNDTDEVYVGPDSSSFTMTSPTGQTATATITQQRTAFRGSEISEDEYRQLTTGLVKATFPTYEDYQGGVSFTFSRTER